MLNVTRFQEMVGISEVERQKMIEAQGEILKFTDEFVNHILGWLDQHHIEYHLPNIEEAIAGLYQTVITNTDPNTFYQLMYKKALKWYQSGLNQTEVTLLLSRLRQFLIQKSEEMQSRDLAHGYCHMVDMATSVFNTIYLLMEESERIQLSVQGELRRFERSFHLLGLTLPKTLVKPYVDHQMWKIAALQLAVGIKNSGQVKFEADESKCLLGQWLENGGLEQLPPKEKEKFIENHRLVHEYGRQALKDAADYHPEHILTYFNQMECASDELSLVLLNLIEDEFIRLATSDHLTGLPNRRSFDLEFKRTLAFAERHNMWVGLIVIDIDHFKQINDTYGHTVGDHVLKQLSSILQKQARTEETPFRWGGEEFALLTIDKKPGGAQQLAKRIRQAVEEADFNKEAQSSFKVTISAGSLCFKPPIGLPTHEIFAKVDKLLYQAKESGRNRVVHQTIHNTKEL